MPAWIMLALCATLAVAGCAPLFSSRPSGRAEQSQAMIAENNLPGDAGWRVPLSALSLTSVQAYASGLDVEPGGSLTFFVSVRQAGMSYRVNVYRLGWYGGAGGRLYTRLGPFTGQAQGYYDQANDRLVNCGSCLVTPQTGEVEARWRPSFTLPIPRDWLSGVYEATLTASDGKIAAVNFDVREDPSHASTYLAITSDTTAAAYNSWGGWSLYVGPGRDVNTHGNVVSLDRPLVPNGPFSWDAQIPFDQGLPYEIDAIRWMERQGYDVSYASSVTLHETPDELTRHAVYISLGHDEYWSKEMRDGVERARPWREPDLHGRERRLLADSLRAR